MARSFEILPTIDEVKVPDFQWQTTFTADPSINVLHCAAPHGQLTGEVVMLTSTGTLPSPFEEFVLYRVLNETLNNADPWPPSWPGPPILPVNVLLRHTGTGIPGTDFIKVILPQPLVIPEHTQVYFYPWFDGHGLEPTGIEPSSVCQILPPAAPSATEFILGFVNGTGYPDDTPIGYLGDSTSQIMMFYGGPSDIALQLAPNAGWNPPPLPPPINIGDMGIGVHNLWIRPLEFVGTVGYGFGNFLSGELVGGRGAIYLDDKKRHQYKNIAGVSGLVVNRDYWTIGSQQRPVVKWNPGVTVGGTGGLVDLYAYGYPARSVWGLGDLGVISTENYYNLCGDFGEPPGGGGGPGGEGGGGGKTPLSPDTHIRIEYKDQDITNLVRRAQKASSIVENMRIVGLGVSGGEGNWQINPG